MRILSLKLENFASYKRCEIDFPSLGNFVVCHGLTGAGKTSLFIDAITFALFGAAYGRKREAAKLVMPPTSTLTRVELVFDLDGRLFKIVRKVSRSGLSVTSDVLLYGPDDLTRVYARGSRIVNAVVEELLGMDYETFLSTVAVRQGDVTSLLLSTRGSERLRLFLRALGIDFEKLRERAKERADELRLRVQRLRDRLRLLEREYVPPERIRSELEKKRRELADVERRLAEIAQELQQLEQERVKLEREKTTLISEITRVEDTLRRVQRARILWNEIASHVDTSDINSLVSALRELRDVLLTLRELRTSLSHAARLKSELELLKRRLSELERQVSRRRALEEEYLTLEARALFAEAALKILQRGERKCPLCGAELTDVAFESLVRGLESDLARLREQAEEVRAELADLREKERELERLRGRLSEVMRRLEEETRRAEQFSQLVVRAKGICERLRLRGDVLSDITGGLSLVDRLLDAARRLEELGFSGELASEDELRSRLSELKRKLTSLEEELKRIEVRAKDLERERLRLARKSGELTSQIKSLEDQLKRSEEIAREIAKIREELPRLEKEMTAYRILAENVFHDRGLPLYILSRYLPAVESRANEFLSRVLPGIRIELKRTVRARESSLDIVVYDHSHAREFMTFSGGEQTLIGFALRLALIDVMTRARLARRPRVLIVDEGFGPLSDELRQRLLDALRDLAREVGQVIVISHVQDVKTYPYFDARVYVEKVGGESRVRIERAR